ncbi:MAG TPA: TIGR03067 domain-containing protein [Gemmataceae bacterium]|nr:TIGR03067 domain-containing protein [Gemmataceae bacterium]
MFRRIAVLFGALALVAADAPKADPKGGDAKAIQGTWTVTSAEMRGEKRSDLVGSTYDLRDGTVTITIKGKDKPVVGTYSLDSSADPKRFDLTPQSETRPMRGIYRLDEDRLTLCTADNPEQERPTKFETHPDRKVVLLVLTRETAPKPGKR